MLPVVPEDLGEVAVVLEVDGLLEIGVRAGVVAAPYVLIPAGCREDHDGDGPEDGVSLDPEEDLAAIGAGQIQVEQDEVGHLMDRAGWVGEAIEIGHRRGAVAEGRQPV